MVDSVKQVFKLKEKKNIHQYNEILEFFQKTNVLVSLCSTLTLKDPKE